MVGGSVTWRNDMFDRECRVKVIDVPTTVATVSLEAFVSDLPRGLDYIRIGLPRVLDFVLGSTFGGDWICRRADRIRDCALKPLDYECGFHLSQKSVLDKARRRSQPPPASEMSNYDRDYSMSVEALVVFLLYIAYSPRMEASGGVDKTSNGLALIDGLVAKFAEAGEQCWQSFASDSG